MQLPRWSVILGIIAGILLIAGTFSEANSLLQKVLFAIGAPLLGITAYVDRQKMFTALQAVATIGAWLAFFPIIFDFLKYGVLLFAGLFSIIALWVFGYYKEDTFGFLGTLGLLCFAVGFATNAASSLVLFSMLFIVGGITLAVYSALNFKIYKVKIALIWVVLNILLAVNPAINLIMLYFK